MAFEGKTCACDKAGLHVIQMGCDACMVRTHKTKGADRNIASTAYTAAFAFFGFVAALALLAAFASGS